MARLCMLTLYVEQAIAAIARPKLAAAPQLT